MVDLRYLEGRRFCVVFAQPEHDDPENPGRIGMRAMHGRANVSPQGELFLEGNLGKFKVPSTAYGMVQPGDESEILQGAEYFVILRVKGMPL